MKMYEILCKNAVRTKVKSANKKQLLQDIANIASEHIGIANMDIAKSGRKVTAFNQMDKLELMVKLKNHIPRIFYLLD